MKQKIRQELIAKRQALSLDYVENKSQIIAQKVTALPEFNKAKTIMVYLAFRNEVDTHHIIQGALVQEKRIVVPISQRQDWKIIPAEIKNYPDDLEEGTYGILEPKPQAYHPVEPQEIDLVLIPGVAFDERGYRLGYGAGYYDRFLSRLRPDAVTMALAYEMQILPDVYPESHDQKVDLIITEERIIKPI